MITLYTKNLKDTWFGVACVEEKIFATALSTDRNRVMHSLLMKIPFNVPFKHSGKASSFTKQVIDALVNIYFGKDFQKKFVLAMEYLPSYTKKVLEAVTLIPSGYVASYGSVAKAVGGSPRAVGRVMASNPFPLIIPCHRVVASNFSLGGYGEGLNVKLEILSRERRGCNSIREVSVNNAKFQVFPVECWVGDKLNNATSLKHK